MTVLNQGYYRSRGHYPPGGSAERCCSQSHCPCASLTTAIESRWKARSMSSRMATCCVSASRIEGQNTPSRYRAFGVLGVFGPSRFTCGFAETSTTLGIPTGGVTPIDT